MKKRLWIVIFSIAALVLGACGNEEADRGEEDLPEILEVELEVQETADVGETVQFLATVTQGDEKVADADEVEFEIWEEGKQEDSEMIEAINNEDGTYVAEKAFEHDGLFTVQVHVTARGMHTMPKKSVTVGEGPAEGSEYRDGDHGHHHHHGHHYHTEGFNMHFMKPEKVEKGKETELMVHLELEDSPMENARVRYEIWNHDLSDKHEWVDAAMAQPGEYTAKHTFEEAGTYMIQIHVEDDEDLHEHEEHEVVVK